MAFVKIYRGQITKRVPEDAFESHYKRLGYRILEKDASSRSEAGEEGHTAGRGYDVDSIPLSDMTQKQLKEYASRNGIDISNATSAREARAIIRKAMQGE